MNVPFTLESGKSLDFRLPTALRCVPIFELLAKIPDDGVVPDSIRQAILIESAGATIGYLWGTNQPAISLDWRSHSSLDQFGAGVVDELVDNRQWTGSDLLKCFSAIVEKMHSLHIPLSEVETAANFTE